MLALSPLIAPPGPFPPDRRIAVAVSGGADSPALALLAAGWGRPLALVCDHGLRPASAAEADLTLQRLAARGIPARLLKLTIPPGPALAARARSARYEALTATCADAGLPHLLLGHHAGDQAETILLRALHGSGPDGRAGMAPLHRSGGVVLLRPLLTVAPARLRDYLRAAGIDWIEDPSNHDRRAERVRLRQMIDDPGGEGGRTAALVAAGAFWARRRATTGATTRRWLADHVVLHAAGHAELPDAPLPPAALAALIGVVSGGDWPPASAAVARLAAAPRPATLGGARLLRAGGRLLLAREAAAMAPPVAAAPGAVWDRRFRLDHLPSDDGQATIGGLGTAAADWRQAADWPAAVLASLPCVRLAGAVIAIPHLEIGPQPWGIGPASWQFSPVARRGPVLFDDIGGPDRAEDGLVINGASM